MSNKKIEGNIFDIKLFKRLLAFAEAYKFNFIISIISALSLTAFALARPVLLQYIIDNFVVQKNAPKLLIYILIMLSLLICQALALFIFIYNANKLGQNIIKDLRIQLFKHISAFKMNFYHKNPVGKIVTRIVSDIETIASIFGQGLFTIISDLLTMIGIMMVMLILNYKLALIAFIALPILIYATRLFQKAMKSAFQEVRKEVANLNTFVQERLSGMKIVQLFNRQNLDYKEFKNINNKHKNAWVKTVWYNSIFFPVAEIIPSIVMGFIVWYGGKEMLSNNETSAGEIISFIMMIQMLFRPLRQIADKFNTLQMGMVAADRVFKIIDEKSNEIDQGNSTNSIKGNINFINVYFSYTKKETVLKGINFNAKHGEKIAIVGATGAGKSTIINLINRFYTINEGKILIDNTNINDYSLQHLRKQIAVVLQDVFLFSDSIYNNITLYNPSINKENVIQAAKQIGIHNFIMSLPNNYDYTVKERGVNLSTGQRQLISFLRAYISNPSILILDEATSSIDSHSEQLIQKATEVLTKNRTSIIIAHRLATIKNADTILVMEKGKIVEQGNHTELILKKGYYHNLYTIQFKE